VSGVVIATALAVRDFGDGPRVLLVASRYANHAQPLWNLPGGRQHARELLYETAERECREETGILVRAGVLAYVSESYDPRGTHVLNATFLAATLDDAAEPSLPHVREAVDHVVAVEWVPIVAIASRVTVAVVRNPLVAFLRNELDRRYAGYAESGITIEWPADSS
jgi:8-oxo-dGTP pyrophosphatase MutT (NUDIX family)